MHINVQGHRNVSRLMMPAVGLILIANEQIQKDRRWILLSVSSSNSGILPSKPKRRVSCNLVYMLQYCRLMRALFLYRYATCSQQPASTHATVFLTCAALASDLNLTEQGRQLTFGAIGSWELASACLHFQDLLDVNAAFLVLGLPIAVGLCNNTRNC